MVRTETIVFAKLSAPLQYVDGDYYDVARAIDSSWYGAPPRGRSITWRFRPGRK